MKEKSFDYGDFPITKLPPGRAHGAGDLARWSQNRAVGASGVSSEKTRTVTVRCSGCQGKTSKLISRFEKRSSVGLQCPHCGKRGKGRIIRK